MNFRYDPNFIIYLNNRIYSFIYKYNHNKYLLIIIIQFKKEKIEREYNILSYITRVELLANTCKMNEIYFLAYEMIFSYK
jgi:hypothetical protein